MKTYKKNSIESNIETAFVRHVAYLKDCKDIGEYNLLKPSGDNIVRQSLKINSSDSIWSDLLEYRETISKRLMSFSLEAINNYKGKYMDSSIDNTPPPTVEQCDVILMTVEYYKQLCNDTRVRPGPTPTFLGKDIIIYNDSNLDEQMEAAAQSFSQEHDREPLFYMILD